VSIPPMISWGVWRERPDYVPGADGVGGIGDHCHKFGVVDNQRRPTMPVQIGGGAGRRR